MSAEMSSKTKKNFRLIESSFSIDETGSNFNIPKLSYIDAHAHLNEVSFLIICPERGMS